MSDKRSLVDELMKYVENEIMRQHFLPSLKIETQPFVQAIEESEEILWSSRSGTHPVVAAQDQAREAIQKWIEAVIQDVYPPQEPY